MPTEYSPTDPVRLALSDQNESLRKGICLWVIACPKVGRRRTFVTEDLRSRKLCVLWGEGRLLSGFEIKLKDDDDKRGK